MSEPLYTVTTQSDDFWCVGSDTPKDPETNARLVRNWSDSTREKILGALFDPETMKDIDIRRFAIGPEWDKLKQGESSGKYFQLVRTSAARPSPTITASGGQVGIAGPTHFVEPRKFTLGELRRICSFPDDFQLTGTYEQRWERLGRAVPPVMMKHIATSVATTLGVVNL
jgi:site-specific DNA-cytosine methylase